MTQRGPALSDSLTDTSQGRPFPLWLGAVIVAVMATIGWVLGDTPVHTRVPAPVRLASPVVDPMPVRPRVAADAQAYGPAHSTTEAFIMPEEAGYTTEPVTPLPIRTVDARSVGVPANCTEARAMGIAPMYRGDPGYSAHMDGDNDGIACEPYRGGGREYRSSRRKRRA